jgi:YNFM family putative membrane transporter
MSYIEKGTKEYNRASIALFLGGFVTFATLYTTQPLLPIFSKEFHVSAPTASLTLSLSTGALALVLLVAAALSDRIGRKQIMVCSMFLTAIIGFLTAFSPNFITLVILRSVLGIVIAGVPSIAMTYVGEEFAPRGLGQIMGLYISGTSIGGMAGRIITGILTDLFTWRIALAAIGALTIILSIVFWRILPAPQHSVKRAVGWKSVLSAYKMHLANKKLMMLIMLSFVLMGSFVMLYNYIGFLLVEPPYDLSQTLIGCIFIVYVAGTISSVYMGRKADQYGRSFILKLSLGIMISGAIMTLIPSLILKIIGISVFTFGFFASHSIASAWVGHDAKHNKAHASSLYLLFYYLGSSLVGSFGGFFWMHFHWIGIIFLITILLIIGYFLIQSSQRGSSFSHGMKM